MSFPRRTSRSLFPRSCPDRYIGRCLRRRFWGRVSIHTSVRCEPCKHATQNAIHTREQGPHTCERTRVNKGHTRVNAIHKRVNKGRGHRAFLCSCIALVVRLCSQYALGCRRVYGRGGTHPLLLHVAYSLILDA